VLVVATTGIEIETFILIDHFYGALVHRLQLQAGGDNANILYSYLAFGTQHKLLANTLRDLLPSYHRNLLIASEAICGLNLS
jgi:hypothetical protein